MPEYKTPGVYIEEVDRGPKTIEGVSTSVAGFLGVTERGPLGPHLVTSFADYRRLYGGYSYDDDWTKHGKNEESLPYAVEGFFTNGGGRAYVTRVVPKSWVDNTFVAEKSLGDGGGTNALKAKAIGPGFWGNGLVVDVADASSNGKDSQDNKRFKFRIGYWQNANSFGASDYDSIKKEKNKGNPDQEEVYDELSPVVSDPNYYRTTINEASSLVAIEELNEGVRPANTSSVESLDMPSTSRDDATTSDDYTWKNYSGRGGLATFEEVDEITMVCVPDADVHSVDGQVVTHCVNRKDRIAILATDNTPSGGDGLSSDIISDYAALYYPYLDVREPGTGLERSIPPTGHVAGIYARSDAEHGVHKAPANEQVRGIDGVAKTVTKGEQASLNPIGINCIREFQGRGIRVWGARTTSSDPSWKYVNVRRLFMYIEESIEEGTNWVVFENNTEELWARVRQTISDFLTTVWEDGGLMGSTPDEAFYVKCDRTTMTQNDIDNGRLICEIGIAPVKPAEFVVFRISQWTAGAEGGG